MNREAVAANREKIIRLVETITAGGVAGPRLTILNEKSAELRQEQ